MAPKGGLGFGLGWAAGNNEYGTTKSVEAGLKKLATISCVIFVITSLIYPFTKEKTFDPDATNATGSVATPSFDLGWPNTGDEQVFIITGSEISTGN